MRLLFIMKYFVPLEKALRDHPALNFKKIVDTYQFARKAHGDQLRKGGGLYIVHPVAVACILLEIDADEDTLIAALLHDTIEDTHVTPEEVVQRYGEGVSHLVDTVTELSRDEFSGSRKKRKLESLRKMLTMGERDKRALVIKIADRIHNMRTIDGHGNYEKQRVIARETGDLFIPMARELGLWKYKNELEELCAPYLFPDDFKKIQQEMASLVTERKKILHNVSQALQGTEAKDIIGKTEAIPHGVFHLHEKKTAFFF